MEEKGWIRGWYRRCCRDVLEITGKAGRMIKQEVLTAARISKEHDVM